MGIGDRVSAEGIPFREYRWGQLLLSLPLTLALWVFYALMKLTIREEPPQLKGDFPPNAFIIMFHTEWPLFPLSPGFWRRYTPGLAWVGIHNFVSYAASLFVYFAGFRTIRYDRKSGIRPMEMVRDYLRQHPEGTYGLRTDSGGPYECVRHSAVNMAIFSGRPVVGVRQRVSRGFRLPNQHWVPLPFGKLSTYVSAPIPAATLAALPVEDARGLLQSMMESLVP